MFEGGSRDFGGYSPSGLGHLWFVGPPTAVKRRIQPRRAGAELVHVPAFRARLSDGSAFDTMGRGHLFRCRGRAG